MFPWSKTNTDKWPNEQSLAEASGGPWYVRPNLGESKLKEKGEMGKVAGEWRTTESDVMVLSTYIVQIPVKSEPQGA